MSDVNIYDDPNILIGDSGTEKYVSNDFKLRTIFKTKLPWENPPEKGVKIFDKWLQTANGTKWCNYWTDLGNLEVDEYIHLYSQFPDQFLDKFISKKEIAYPVYKGLQNYQIGTSKWLYWLVHFDRVKPLELENTQLLEFELGARASLARLNICRELISSPEVWFSEFFENNPAFLWLWWEIGYCLNNIKARGIENPIEPSEIQTKREIEKNIGIYFSTIEDVENILPSSDKFEPKIKTNNLNGIKDLIVNVGGIMQVISSKISAYDTNFRDTYFLPYTKLIKLINEIKQHDPKYQHSYIYNDGRNTGLFTTGKNKKRPKKKKALKNLSYPIVKKY